MMMRFTKAEVLEAFRRQEAAYRVAIVASHWLRGSTNYKPSAAEEARSLQMEALGRWMSFADVADQLETDPEAVSSELVLNQLHASIRFPFEMLRDYCNDYDSFTGREELLPRLWSAEWYVYAWAIRNAASHNFLFNFRGAIKSRLPTTWHGITITPEMEGTPLSWNTFGARPGHALVLTMRAFATELPELELVGEKKPPEGG